MAKIDAAKSNISISKPRKIVVHLGRTREVEIVSEALAYTQAAGIELEYLFLKRKVIQMLAWD